MAYPAFLSSCFSSSSFRQTGSRVPAVWQGDVAGYVIPKLKVFGGLAVLGGIIVALNQTRRAEFWRGVWEWLFHRLPVVGRARRSMAARLSMALEALLNAGVNTLQAWELSAAASGSPALRRATRRALRDIGGGATPGEAIASTGNLSVEICQHVP